MNKRIISVVAVLAVLAACVVGMVACAGEKLDGKYIEDGQENWYIVIEGNSIKYIKQELDKSEKLIASGTFTVEGNKLIISAGFENDLVSASFDKDKQHLVLKYDKGQTYTYTKQRTNK